MARLRAAGITHRGRVRDGNEDRIAIAEWVPLRPMAAPLSVETELSGALLCVVADGMGGHAAGEVASAMAVHRLVAGADEITDEAALGIALAALNRSVFAAMEEDPSLAGMGTTVAGIVFHADRAIGFNVGDSRIYVENHGLLRRLSTDDTPEAALSAEGGEVLRRSHAVTQAIGGAPAFGDVFPHLWTMPLAERRRFILCTDGLTDMVDPDAMESCLAADAVHTARRLFDAAMAAGGVDNVSVIVADFLPDRVSAGGGRRPRAARAARRR